MGAISRSHIILLSFVNDMKNKWCISLIKFYLQSSIHVAFSVYALVRMTYYQFQIPSDKAMTSFAFFGSIVGYNFVKYDALARSKKLEMSLVLKMIALLSFFCFSVVVYNFFQLQTLTQVAAVGFLILTLLYTLPFFPNKKNARNLAGIKIYIVAFCWVGVTLLLPLINANIDFTTDVYLKFIQRFLLVFILTLIFEILDLKYDAISLQTIPQRLGVRHTKMLGLFLLLPFYFLELLKVHFDFVQLYINLVLVISIASLLIFAHPHRSKYYTTFWVESVPICWWLMLVL